MANNCPGGVRQSVWVLRQQWANSRPLPASPMSSSAVGAGVPVALLLLLALGRRLHSSLATTVPLKSWSDRHASALRLRLPGSTTHVLRAPPERPSLPIRERI